MGTPCGSRAIPPDDKGRVHLLHGRGGTTTESRRWPDMTKVYDSLSRCPYLSGSDVRHGPADRLGVSRTSIAKGHQQCQPRLDIPENDKGP